MLLSHRPLSSFPFYRVWLGRRDRAYLGIEDNLSGKFLSLIPATTTSASEMLRSGAKLRLLLSYESLLNASFFPKPILPK